MTSREKIEEWIPPTWHSDFGDPEAEVNLLKSISLKILELGFTYSFELDCYEEGYMRVEVKDEQSIRFDIHVIDSENLKIGLFFPDGAEYYIHHIDEIGKYLKSV